MSGTAQISKVRIKGQGFIGSKCLLACEQCRLKILSSAAARDSSLCVAVVHLVTLECFMFWKEDAENHFKYLIDVIEIETQPSLRHLAEWMLIRLVSAQPSLHSAVWQRFEQVSAHFGCTIE